MVRESLESEISADLRAMAAVSEQIGLVFAAKHELRSNDFRALMHIMVADVEGRPLTAGDLARLLGMSSAAMTYLVERMTESGHIRRESDAADRRKKWREASSRRWVSAPARRSRIFPTRTWIPRIASSSPSSPRCASTTTTSTASYFSKAPASTGRAGAREVATVVKR